MLDGFYPGLNWLSFKKQFPKPAQSTIFAHNATVVGNVSIGDSSSVWYNAIVRGMWTCKGECGIGLSPPLHMCYELCVYVYMHMRVHVPGRPCLTLQVTRVLYGLATIRMSRTGPLLLAVMAHRTACPQPHTLAIIAPSVRHSRIGRIICHTVPANAAP